MKRPNVERMSKYNHQPSINPPPLVEWEDEMTRQFGRDEFDSFMMQEWIREFETRMARKHSRELGIVDVTYVQAGYEWFNCTVRWRSIYKVPKFEFPKFIESKHFVLPYAIADIEHTKRMFFGITDV